jgi:hypothetical protein
MRFERRSRLLFDQNRAWQGKDCVLVERLAAGLDEPRYAG